MGQDLKRSDGNLAPPFNELVREMVEEDVKLVTCVKADREALNKRIGQNLKM
jgi:hypothetical protein